MSARFIRYNDTQHIDTHNRYWKYAVCYHERLEHDGWKPAEYYMILATADHFRRIDIETNERLISNAIQKQMETE